MELQTLSQIAPHYRAVFCDSYGVLRDARGLLPDAQPALAYLRELGVPLWVITNDASRPARELAPPFGGAVGPERFVSSGLVLSRHLRQRAPAGPVAYLGPPGCAGLLDDAGVEHARLVELDSLDEVSTIALMDDEGWDWTRELNRIVNRARRYPDLEVLLPNPDLVYPIGDEVRLAAGALGALLRELLPLAPRSFGKPEAAIFAHAFDLARAELPGLERSEVLMIGDTLTTDVLGAARFGLGTALVLSGNTPAAHVEREVERAGVGPDHLLAGIAP